MGQHTRSLADYARTELAAIALTLDDAEPLATGTDFAPEALSTLTALDAVHRLRAEHTGTPTAVAAYAPVLPPAFPIAVASTGTGTGSGSGLSIASGDLDVEVDPADALGVLQGLGVHRGAATHRTLVVDTPATLRTLTGAAHRHPCAAAAPVVDWWAQRADHPGTGATLILTAALPLRWTLGLAPHPSPDLDTWATWLGTTAVSPAATVLATSAALAGGATLPGLLTPDSRSFAELRKRSDTRWAGPDSRKDAAIGLARRCHAAELYASLRLDDPFVAQTQTRTGEVITGTVQQHDAAAHTLTIACPTPLSRFRTGNRANGWTGHPADVQRPGWTTAEVSEITVDPTGALLVTLARTVTTGERKPQPGDPFTLRPARVDPFLQNHAVGHLFRHYATPDNWLSRRAAAPVARRAVPLDVVLAAAEN